MKIFIIDDEQVSLFITQGILAMNGVKEEIYSFLFAEQALEALSKYTEKELPDVILLDLNMPIMNGWDFLEELSLVRPKVCEKCRIYILTSSLDSLDKQKAKDHPMITGLIHKPITSDSIKLIASQSTATF